MLDTIYETKGKLPGPNVLVLGGVHGNEICGVDAIERLKDISIQSGTLRQIIANPEAVKQGKRFIDENLNRVIRENSDPKTYEAKIAQYLLPHLRWADYCLDVHASNTPNTTPFIIGKDSELASSIPIDLVVTNMTKFYPDSTVGYAERHSTRSIAIEGGYVADPQSTDVAVVSIQNFLVRAGIVPGEIQPTLQRRLEIFDQYHNNDEFVPQDFSDFELVKEGQLLGYDGSKPIHAKDEGRIMFPRKRASGFGECYFLAKEV